MVGFEDGYDERLVPMVEFEDEGIISIVGFVDEYDELVLPMVEFERISSSSRTFSS
jgi:hypothetical protein